MRNSGYILKAVLIFGVLLIGSGFFLVAGHTFSGSMQESTEQIIPLSSSWTAYYDGKTEIIKTPANLTLNDADQTLAIEAKIPQDKIKDGIIRFQIMFQKTTMYIDNQKVAAYGNIGDGFNFPYENASHLFYYELKPNDYGKTIRIEFESKFASELSNIRLIEMGSHHSFLMRDIISDFLILMINVVIICFAITLFIAFLYMHKDYKKRRIILLLAVFTAMIALIYTCDITFLWEIFHYDFRLSAFNDLKYYIADALLPSLGFICLQTMLPIMKGKQRYGVYAQSGIFIITAILHIFHIISINYFRPLVMICLLINMIWFTKTYYKIWREKHQWRFFCLAIWLILACVLMDYLRYILGLLPFQVRLFTYLSLDLPFQFLLGWGSVGYMLIIFYGLYQMAYKQRAEHDMEAVLFAQQMDSAKAQYEHLRDSMEQVRKIKHDIKYQYQVMNTLYLKGEYEQLGNYIKQFNNDISFLDLSPYCECYSANVLIGHYVRICQESQIDFQVEANIPEGIFQNEIDLNIVLGNMLENALEACRRMEEGKRFMNLHTRIHKQYLTIQVINSYNGVLHYSSEGLSSTKKDRGHGIGLKSLQQIAVHHQGFFETEYTDRIFTSKMVLLIDPSDTPELTSRDTDDTVA